MHVRMHGNKQMLCMHMLESSYDRDVRIFDQFI